MFPSAVKQLCNGATGTFGRQMNLKKLQNCICLNTDTNTCTNTNYNLQNTISKLGDTCCMPRICLSQFVPKFNVLHCKYSALHWNHFHRNKHAKLNGGVRAQWSNSTVKGWQNLIGDSQSFQKSALDGDVSTNIQILAEALLSGFWHRWYFLEWFLAILNIPMQLETA